MEEMINSTLNFTTESSTNSTTHYIGLIDSLNICMYGICCIIGFPTHSYVLWLIVTGTNGAASEFFNLNLSVSEIGICLGCFVHAISYCFFSVSPAKRFFVGLTITGRPVFQCLICVERYLAVVHPVTFLKSKPLRYRLICCTAAWLLVLVSCVCCLHTMSDDNRHFYIYAWFFSTQFLLFLLIQFFCLVAVLRALKQSGPGDRRREEENHMKRRAFHLILITTVSMTIIYGPYTIIGLMSVVTKQAIDLVWLIGFICYVLAGFVHPVLYLCCTRKLSCFWLQQ